MKKLYIKDSSDYFIKVIQPRINRIKEQDPFDNYQYKHLNYYNKKVWDVMNIKVKQDESKRAARARAFSVAKRKVFFNPDLRYFITLTYKENMQDYEKLKTDIKVFIKSEKRNNKTNKLNKPEPKYLWVVEKQKRGALHIHMICNEFITLKTNRYNKKTLSYWKHGFDNIEDIQIHDSTKTDINFKPYLYLFKYMKKSEKIGGRYIHSSRNLNNYEVLTDFNFDKSTKTKLYTEHSLMGSIDRKIRRVYYTNNN